MTRATLTKCLFAVALVCPLGCGSSVSGVNQSDAAKATPDFTMTAEAWAEEMKRTKPEEIAQKYLNKLVELTGTVASYRRPYPREEHYQFSNNGLHFVVIDDAGKKALPGQTVTVRGIVNQSDGSLGQAVILDVTGPPPPTFTVQQLIDMHNAKQPLPDYPVIVEGKVVSNGTSKGYTLHIRLTPDDTDPRVECWLNPFGAGIRDYQRELGAGRLPAVGHRFSFLTSKVHVGERGISMGGTLLELLD